MAKIAPFKAYRPNPDFVSSVVSKPYDVISRKEAKEELITNPKSFFSVIRSEASCPDDMSPYDKEVYNRAKENFNHMVDQKWMIQDQEESIYVYRLSWKGIVQHGFVCVASIDDYVDDIIKKHEYTRPEKEIDRITHMKVSGLHSGPVFQAYKQSDMLRDEVAKITQSSAEVVFVKDEVEHALWRISEANSIQKITDEFNQNIGNTYIADGHHRAASSTKTGLWMREQKPNYNGSEAFNYMLTVLFPNDEVHIIDYNRVIQDLNGLSEEEFITKLNENFKVESSSTAVLPNARGTFGMYLKGQWYQMIYKHENQRSSNAVNGLDISILDQSVFKPILNIMDQRTDKRIDFIGGIRGLQELEKRVDSSTMKVAFSIYPVTMQELFDVADSGNVMPPKTTWFEPKLASGLFVHQFKTI